MHDFEFAVRIANGSMTSFMGVPKREEVHLEMHTDSKSLVDAVENLSRGTANTVRR